MKDTISSITATLNLNATQVAVYMATLELGEASILAISKKSGVQRSSIYNFLEELKVRGILIETRKKKRIVYSAAPPRTLLELERTRLKEFEHILPELEAVENKSRHKPRVTFYQGVEGLKEVYADSLKEGKPIQAFWDYENAEKAMGNYLETYYRPERKRRNIFYQGILRDSLTTRESLKDDNKAFRESKFITKGEFTTEINIYGNKIALMSFRANPPLGVLIEDKDIADTLRTAWENLWDKLGDTAKHKNTRTTIKTSSE